MNRIKHYIDKEEDLFYEEFHIAKKNGKTRRICAPSPNLKAQQRRLMPGLYNEFRENSTIVGVYNDFHGFLPDRNIVTGAARHIGYNTTVLMDISNCFDSIHQEETFCYDILVNRDGTLAQGFVTSPILANIYLIPVVREMKAQLDQLGIIYVVTVYADDIIISTDNTDYNYINMIPVIVKSVLNKYKLEMNPAKTRIRYAKYGRRKILGIMVGEEDLKPSRKLKGKIRAARFQGNGPSLGGLITASRNYLPKSLRPSED